jgi:hypothetical protein
VLAFGVMQAVDERMLSTTRPDLEVCFRFSGHHQWRSFGRSQLTAVRRYVTG